MIAILAAIFWIAMPQLAPQGPGADARLIGRASISGAAVATDSSQPLVNVTLRLVPLDAPPIAPAAPLSGRGGTPAVSNQVTSDETGKFVFLGVAPGRYTISADRDGFEHFESGPGRSVSGVLNITGGQKVEGLVVALSSLPAISGVVYSPNGQRLAGATIQAYRVQYTPYGRQMVRVAMAMSHEGGDYRLFFLTPGYYYVSASYSDQAQRPWKAQLELSPNLISPDEGWSTVFYPSEIRASDAHAVNLYGGSAANVDIGFRDSRYFKLSVKLILPVPPSPTGPFLLNPRPALFPAGSDLVTIQDYAIKGSGANFHVDPLAEGDYVLVAVADFVDATGRPYTGIVSETLSIKVHQNTETTLALMYPIEIPGVINRSVGFATRNPMQVQLVRVDSLARQTISVDADASGRFNFINIGPGTYDVFLKGLPDNMQLAEARFSYADRRLLQATVSATLPQRTWRCDGECKILRLISDETLLLTFVGIGNPVLGTALDGQGRPVVADVVLVPNDPVFRLRQDRYFVTRSDTSGAFEIRGVPAGAYTAYAFEKLEPEIYFDSEFNLQVEPLGREVTTGGAVNRSLDRPLTLISRDEVLRRIH